MSGGESRTAAVTVMWDYLKSVFNYGADMIKAAGDYMALKIKASIASMGGKAGRATADIMNKAADDTLYFGGVKARANLEIEQARIKKELAKLEKPAFVGPPEPPPAPVVLPPVDEDAVDEVAAASDESLRILEEEKQARATLEAEETEAIKAELIKRHENAKEAAEKELALAEELAKKKIAEFIAEAKEKRDGEKQAAKEKAREDAKAAIFEDRLKKGGALSKKQREWLDAFNAIKGAGQALPGLRDQIKVAEDNLAQLRETNRNLAQIQKDLALHNGKLDGLLKMG
jgi:hypothetical protein